MHSCYQAGMTLKEIGAIFGISRQQVDNTIRHLPDFKRRFQRTKPIVTFRGLNYGPGKDGYYRCTTGARGPLSHAVWEAYHGPIPEGAKILHLGEHTSTDPKDYALWTVEMQAARMRVIGRINCYKPLPEGSHRNWLMGKVRKFQGKWMLDERALYLEAGGTIEQGQVVYKGQAMGRDEASSLENSQLPEELHEVGRLLFKIKKTIKQRRRHGNKNKNQ